MAIKLSSYYWFRNNYLVGSLEDKSRERYFFGKELSLEDRKTLRFIIDELDELKENSHFRQGKSVRAEHVAILNVVELKDVTSNPELAAAYLQGIHKIMEKYWVDAELYRQLGNCFDELGIQPSKDIAEAVKYAADKRERERFGQVNVCWQDIKEREIKREELRKEDPWAYYNLCRD